MSKTSVFIYGSCVSRDTFEHFDPDQFKLVQYVARQSALSAYTRPVTLVRPPLLESSFQQRMVTGDFESSLQALIPEAAPRTDLVLVDLTDERLGAYVLPDGSVVTRSPELIASGMEQQLPAGSQHLPFGSEQHFQYWSQGIAAVGELVRRHMPRAAVVLLDIPWAERSETGAPTPESFGVSARDANPVLAQYVRAAASALGAQLVSLSPDQVTSSPDHSWGEAPFHYSRGVYEHVVRELTGTEPRRSAEEMPSGHAQDGQDRLRTPVTAPARPSVAQRVASGSRVATPRQQADGRGGELPSGPTFLLAGMQRAGTTWLEARLRAHPDVFMAPPGTAHFFNRPQTDDRRHRYVAAFRKGESAKFRGERTPTYVRTPDAASPWSVKSPIDTAAVAAAQLSDDAQVVVVLRDPVSRAVSAYWKHVQTGHLDADTGIFRASPALGVVDLGFYRRHLEHWRAAFGSDRVHVLLHDDLVADPAAFLRSALHALGIPGGAPSYWEGLPLGNRESSTPGWLAPFRKKHPISRQEIEALHVIYRDDVRYVEKLLGRELPRWYEAGRPGR